MGDNQALAAAPTVALTLRFWRARGSAYLRYVRTILNHVLRGFLCGFRILRHVVEDVVFHEFPIRLLVAPRAAARRRRISEHCSSPLGPLGRCLRDAGEGREGWSKQTPERFARGLEFHEALNGRIEMLSNPINTRETLRLFLRSNVLGAAREMLASPEIAICPYERRPGFASLSRHRTKATRATFRQQFLNRRRSRVDTRFPSQGLRIV